MAKKRIDDDEEDFSGDYELELNESDFKFEGEEDEKESENDIENELFDFGSDDEELDIVIEIDDEDLKLETEPEETTKTEEEIVLSKHKIEGKHSLKYDSIFKGKKEEVSEDDNIDVYLSWRKDTIEVDRSSNYHTESIDNESYIRTKLVKERVYFVLKEYTSLNFMNNRRKPSKNDFNNYYQLLKTNLKDESFTNIELFNELSVYFSDNLFNMFKLLDNKWRNLIITELQDHIGKNKNSREVTNRNIYEGTELEFIWEDEFGEHKVITGVVLETWYDISTFKVDSYENIYEVELSQVTKILNNTKFKYNLNKLNNIDFL
jgi:hypothetical protein